MIDSVHFRGSPSAVIARVENFIMCNLVPVITRKFVDCGNVIRMTVRIAGLLYESWLSRIISTSYLVAGIDGFAFQFCR